MMVRAGCVGNDLMLVMYDSWGDGWNGNIFTIGTETATLLTGSLDTFISVSQTDVTLFLVTVVYTNLKLLGNYMII